MKPSQLIENLINYRNEDKERCNMLLLMLVVSEALPACLYYCGNLIIIEFIIRGHILGLHPYTQKI